MATTSSVCVAATCRCRTASRARRSATSTNRVTTHAEHASRRRPDQHDGATTRRAGIGLMRGAISPVTMQVIVPGATSVNPASRTATASPASTARHSCGQARRARVAHGERGHRDQPVRRRVQHRRVPHLRRRLADRHLERRVDVDHRYARAAGGPGSSGARSVPPICSRETTLGTSSTGPGSERAGLRVADGDRDPRQLLHRRPVRAAGPSGDLADAARHPGGERVVPLVGGPRVQADRERGAPRRPPARRCAPRAAAPAAARSASRAPRRPARAGSPPGPRARPRSGRRAAPAGRRRGVRRWEHVGAEPSAASARSTSSRVMPRTNSTTSRYGRRQRGVGDLGAARAWR